MSNLSDRERLLKIFEADDIYTASDNRYPDELMEVISQMRRGFKMPDGYVAPAPFGESVTDDLDRRSSGAPEQAT